jgi:aldose 1-epimerase
MPVQNQNPMFRMTRRGFLLASGAATACALAGCRSMPGASMENFPRKLALYKSLFGITPHGAKVYQYTLTNSHGMVVRLITYGARVQRIQAPDAHGNIGDVALGYETLPPYLNADDPYFGATIGRYANRIANGTFTLNGKTYHIPINNGPNALHGGPNAFDRQVWNATAVQEAGRPGVRFNLFSPAMQNGFPGDLETAATYLLSDQNELLIHLRANVAGSPTVINLTNHTYFNLAGPGTKILNHRLMINADRYTPVNKVLIPTGQILTVAGTPYDFRKPVLLASRIKPFPAGSKANSDLIPYGYDYNWCLNAQDGKMTLAARLEEHATGRVLECFTTQPGLQVYTGNYLNGTLQGIGGAYPRHGAITLETQHYPDSPNHPNFPSTVLTPSETYYQKTVYRFRTLQP